MTMSDARATQTGLAEIVERNLPALTELCRRFGVRRLDLFGSAATGRFDPARSDLDFLVEFDPMPPRGGFRGPYFGLLEALETLFARKVDLLTEQSLENPYRRRRIEAEKRTLYQAPP
jgi:predicted nucleotidyltransferase